MDKLFIDKVTFGRGLLCDSGFTSETRSRPYVDIDYAVILDGEEIPGKIRLFEDTEPIEQMTIKEFRRMILNRVLAEYKLEVKLGR
jgi:hypothetical protein